MSDIKKWDEVDGVDESPGHLTAFLESALPIRSRRFAMLRSKL